jgi:hypothetical protein
VNGWLRNRLVSGFKTYHDIAPGNLEAVEVLTCVFRVVDILVDNIRSATCLTGGSKTHLAQSAVLAKDIVHFFGRYLVGQAPARQRGVKDDAKQLAPRSFKLRFTTHLALGLLERVCRSRVVPYVENSVDLGGQP